MSRVPGPSPRDDFAAHRPILFEPNLQLVAHARVDLAQRVDAGVLPGLDGLRLLRRAVGRLNDLDLAAGEGLTALGASETGRLGRDHIQFDSQSLLAATNTTFRGLISFCPPCRSVRILFAFLPVCL